MSSPPSARRPDAMTSLPVAHIMLPVSGELDDELYVPAVASSASR